MPTVKYSAQDMDELMVKAYKGKIATATIALTFLSPCVGGQPAKDDGVRAFCQYQLKLTGDMLEEAVKRIQATEIRKDKPEDELIEKESYGVNVLRRAPDQTAYVGTWQVRAMLKQAASRLGVFEAKKGSKGDLAEAMWVKAVGKSDINVYKAIGLVGPDGQLYKGHNFERHMGNVGTATGRTSIVHDSEYAPIGSSITFQVRWPTKKVTPDLMAAILYLAQNIGLGSVKSQEFGRFELTDVTVEIPEKSGDDAEE